ncbi:MAG: hypothetical protein ACREMY_07320 [bacterium]
MSEDYAYRDEHQDDELTPEQRDEIRRRIQALLTPESVERLRKLSADYVRATRRRERRRRLVRYALVGVTAVALGLLVFFA